MLDDLVPTIAANKSTAPGFEHNFYVTYFDENSNQYVNTTHNDTEVSTPVFLNLTFSFIKLWWHYSERTAILLAVTVDI